MQKQNILRYASVKCTNPAPGYKNQALFQNSVIYSKTKEGLGRRDELSPSGYSKNFRLMTEGAEPCEKSKANLYASSGERQARKRESFEVRLKEQEKKAIEQSSSIKLQKGSSEKQFKYIVNANTKKCDYLKKDKPANYLQAWTKTDGPFRQLNNFVEGRLSSELGGKTINNTSVLNFGEQYWNIKQVGEKPATGYLKRTVKTEADEGFGNGNAAQMDEKSPQFYNRKSYRNVIRKTQTDEQIVRNVIDPKSRMTATFTGQKYERSSKIGEKMAFEKVFITKDGKDNKTSNQNKENRRTTAPRQRTEQVNERQRYTTNLNEQRQARSPEGGRQQLFSNISNIVHQGSKAGNMKKPQQLLNNQKYLGQNNGIKKTRMNTEQNDKDPKSYMYRQKVQMTSDKEQVGKILTGAEKPIDWKRELMLMQKIGQGTFGKVYKARLREDSSNNNPTTTLYAIKKVYIDKKYKSRQLQIVQQLSHPQVMKVHNVFVTTKDANQQYLNIVMDFYDKNLFELINESAVKGGGRQPFAVSKGTELQQKVFVYQILKGLSYIHSLRICHRDIKPHNMLVKGWELVLCDFGSAKKLNPGEDNLSYICSRCYRAPELIFGSTGYTTQIDMWSVACVIIEMLHGMPLFIGENSLDHLLQVIKVVGTPSKQQVLQMNPSYDISQYDLPVIKRKSFSKLFPKADPKLIDLVNKIMVYNPYERLSAIQALAHPYFDELRREETYKVLLGYLPRGKLETLYEFSEKQMELYVATCEARGRVGKAMVKEKEPRMVRRASEMREALTPGWIQKREG